MEEKEKIVRLLKALFPGVKIFLYGSRARRTHKETSDYDIAVDAGHRLTIQEISQAKNILDQLYIPQKIDLVDIHSVDKSMRENIFKDGIEWTS